MGLPPELAFVFGETESVFHRTRVRSREMIADNTLALTIERPSGFTYTPGQNTMISLPGPLAEELKEFTIASAPSDSVVTIAMRVRHSKFKNACYALKPGDAITMRSPSGSLWESTAGPQVWISGGVGITPFRGIMRELIHTHASYSITHMHSDRRRSSIPFLKDFESYASAYAGYAFTPTMTREAVSGEHKGRISADMIAACAPEYARSHFFVVGTEAFVTAMRSEIVQLGVSADRIRTERFEGYKASEY